MFDSAITAAEGTPKGYWVGGTEYGSYMSNAAWEVYLSEMRDVHRCQYVAGSGGELEEKNGRPPKMASFASSSRMIHNLSKDIPGFVFEKQLPTVIGGKANLDGFLEAGRSCIFVEAKCREPYSHTAIQTIKKNYKSVYACLREKMPRVFSCVMEEIPDNRDMKVVFFCRGEAVAYFDIKQMICHLLSVANEMLSREEEKDVLFLYLLYNPAGLKLPQESREEILGIFEDTCRMALGYRFNEMYGHIVDFLVKETCMSISAEKIEGLKRAFRFVLCDQHTYKTYLK